jgi:hypothetical protein
MEGTMDNRDQDVHRRLVAALSEELDGIQRELCLSDAELLQACLRHSLRMMSLSPTAGVELLRNMADEIEHRPARTP